MSFRTEKKYLVTNNRYFDLFRYFQLNNIKEIFEQRVVSSIYFDNDTFSIYQDSIEGIVPRKKIRIRHYSNTEKFKLEEKISSVEGRFKISKVTNKSNEILQKGIMDKNYLFLKPKVIVNYKRNYFSFHNLRFTLDTNIYYEKYVFNKKNNVQFKDEMKILELKGPKELAYNEIIQKIPFKEIRFSKYCRAVSSIFSVKKQFIDEERKTFLC